MFTEVKTQKYEGEEEIECEDEEEKVSWFSGYIALFRKMFTEVNASGKRFPKV
jgi:hypothetical protein